MRRFFFALAITLAAGKGEAQQTLPPAAVLQGLDKLTSHVLKLTVAVGEAADFGTLTLYVEACVKRPPEEPPESAAFLRIIDHPPLSSLPLDPAAVPFDPPQDRLAFSGWMFASSPALNALEHPVFDVILLDCRLAKEGSRVSAK